MGPPEVAAFVGLTKSLIDLSLTLHNKSTPTSSSRKKEEASLNDDISFIKDEFEMMVSHLLDDASDGRHRNSSTSRTWVRQVRNLTYDVEDSFQELVVHLEKPPRSPSKPQARKVVVDRIRSLREKIRQCNQRYMQAHQHQQQQAGGLPTDQHNKKQFFVAMPNSFAFKQSLLVGREMEKSHIIQIITKDNQMRQIIPIWGMGGLGKTALARSIYENQDIRGMFQKHAWMNLSHSYNAEEFFRSLVLQLTEDDITIQELLKNMQLKDLIEESNKLLRTRRYLIVLDNVSSIAEWKFLIEYITDEENASRIIATTREKSVAEHCSIDNIYKLEALKDTSALQLFKKKVLEEIGGYSIPFLSDLNTEGFNLSQSPSIPIKPDKSLEFFNELLFSIQL